MVIPQACVPPALTEVKDIPSGVSCWPFSLLPQQAGELSAFMPQVKAFPADSDMNWVPARSAGTAPAPKSPPPLAASLLLIRSSAQPPQQTAVPSVFTPQE